MSPSISLLKKNSEYNTDLIKLVIFLYCNESLLTDIILTWCLILKRENYLIK